MNPHGGAIVRAGKRKMLRGWRPARGAFVGKMDECNSSPDGPNRIILWILEIQPPICRDFCILLILRLFRGFPVWISVVKDATF